jgi:phage tail tape-measure protein
MSSRRNLKRLFNAHLVAVAALFIATNGAEAKGCLKGAAVGAVAGHVAGHHAVIGAAAGCAIGHHMAKKQQQQPSSQPPQQQTNPPQQTPIELPLLHREQLPRLSTEGRHSAGRTEPSET